MIFSSILTIIFAYLLNSISSAILICKLLNLPDPRYYGSKNPGSTNIFRIAGYKIAINVVLLDIFKGALPTWLGFYLNIPFYCIGIVSIVSCLGHIYPIFFQFHGGKGVATNLGILIAIKFKLALINMVIWIVTVLLSGYPSLGSIIIICTTPFCTWYILPQYLIYTITISILIMIRHAKNIKRLWNKQEKNILR